MNSSPGRQQAKSDKTRATLIEVARSCFGKSGYQATNTSDLTAQASVTRGALYHHFADKQDLFAAVAWQVATELGEAAAAQGLSVQAGTWRRLQMGLTSYLQLVASNPETGRILLIDGPSVLGWQRWRDIQSEVLLPGMVDAFERLTAQGVIRISAAAPMAHLILATLNDAALTVAHAADPEAARATMSTALSELIQGLAATSSVSLDA